MTKLEAKQYLFHKKVYLKNKSNEVTNKLLDLGYQWENIDINLYIFIDSVWNVHSTVNPNEFYSNEDYAEISVEDFLNLEVTSDAEYRPFKNGDECLEEMQKHQPFGWVKNVNDEKYFIYEVSDGIGTSESFHPYGEALCTVKFLDDTPFGIKLVGSSEAIENEQNSVEEPHEQKLNESKETSKDEDLSGYPTIDGKPFSWELLKQVLHEMDENDPETLAEREEIRTFQKSVEEFLKQKLSLYETVVKLGESLVHIKAEDRYDIIDEIGELMNMLDEENDLNNEIMEYLSEQHDKATDKSSRTYTFDD